MFSFTNQLLAAAHTPDELLEGLLSSHAARAVELDAAQHFRGFPFISSAEIDATCALLDRFGASASLLGIYLDVAPAPGAVLDRAESLDQLRAQVRAASEIGFWGVRVPVGLLSDESISDIVPDLESAGICLVQEFQGVMRPDSPVMEHQFELIDGCDTDKLGLLIDLSVCMPALPVSYPAALSAAGVPDSVIDVVIEQWGHIPPADLRDNIATTLGDHQLIGSAVPLLLTSHTRFGSSKVSDWKDVLPRVRSVHLKYWDVDNSDDRIGEPIRELRDALDSIDYRGFFCSEWGGHEWTTTSTDPIDMTVKHRAIFDSAASKS